MVHPTIHLALPPFPILCTFLDTSMLKVKDPKYNSYKGLEERIKTFKKWPLRFMTSKDLANEGFIYTGKKDLVLCVYCGVIIEQWEEGDVPNMEHQKNSPRCPFVCMLSDIESASGMSIYIFVANIQIPR